jgi:hypothetical protein
VVASCTNNGTSATLTVRANGPSDSSDDGSLVGGNFPGVFSDTGSSMHVGDDFTGVINSNEAEALNLDLFSASSGGAHISMFRYLQGPSFGSGFRCKISGTGYPAS